MVDCVSLPLCLSPSLPLSLLCLYTHAFSKTSLLTITEMAWAATGRARRGQERNKDHWFGRCLCNDLSEALALLAPPPSLVLRARANSFALEQLCTDLELADVDRYRLLCLSIRATEDAFRY